MYIPDIVCKNIFCFDKYFIEKKKNKINSSIDADADYDPRGRFAKKKNSFLVPDFNIEPDNTISQQNASFQCH